MVFVDWFVGNSHFSIYLYGSSMVKKCYFTRLLNNQKQHRSFLSFFLELVIDFDHTGVFFQKNSGCCNSLCLLHCTDYFIPPCSEDGILLLEVNKMLRAGGYLAWAAQPIYKLKRANKRISIKGSPFYISAYI